MIREDYPYKTWPPQSSGHSLISHAEVVSSTPVMKVERLVLTDAGKKALTSTSNDLLLADINALQLRQKTHQKMVENFQQMVASRPPAPRYLPGQNPWIYVVCGMVIGLGIVSLFDAIGKIIGV